MNAPPHRAQGNTAAWLTCFGGAVAIGVCITVATPRVATLAVGLGALCAVAALAVLVTTATWLRRAGGWQNARGGLFLAIGVLLLITAVGAAVMWLAIGLRTLTV
jgi:hypothetical protein